MMVATLRAVRVTALLLIPEIYAEWRAATRDALAQVTAEERATVEKLVRDVLELLAECGQADAPAQ